jgi:hypothetical protein
MNSWSFNEDETIRDMSNAMIEKYDKYWTNIHGLMVVVVILDPRLKMTMLHACYIAIFGQEAAEKYVTEAHELLIDLMKHYHVREQEFVSTSSSGAQSSVNAAVVFEIFKTLMKIRRPLALSEVRMSWIAIWRKNLFLMIRMTTLIYWVGGNWRELVILL